MKKKIIIIQIAVFIILVLISFFLRFYKLNQMFDFFGDIARDHERLMEWYQGAKPPLLGPNTILMIINQSPWYYYLNYPVFVIIRSPFTMTITLFLISVIAFALSLWLLRKYKEILFIYIIFFLSSIHPMFVEQQRIPWNPSFSVPLLILAMAGMLRLKNKYHVLVSWITAISLCLALGMTYTVFPVFLVIAIFILFFIPAKHRLHWLFQLGIGMFIVFFPLVIFEIRSNFFTIKRLTTGLNIPAVHYSFAKKFMLDVSTFLTGSENIKVKLWQLALLIIPMLINCYLAIIKPHKNYRYFRLFFATAILTTGLILLMPFQQPYYLYGIILLWFLTIASMRPILMFPVLIGLVILWINPVWLNNYFRQSSRPLDQLNSCARQFCRENPGQYYVAANSLLGIHSAHEHAFLLNANGCRSRDIVSFPLLNYDKMVVVADGAEFKPYQTSFYELERFGKYDVGKYLYCSKNLQYWLLRKIK